MVLQLLQLEVKVRRGEGDKRQQLPVHEQQATDCVHIKYAKP